MPPCQNFPTGQPASLASIINEKPNILTKRPSAAITVPFGMNNVIGALAYRGIPLDQRSRRKQSHHVPGALLSGDFRQSIVSNGRPHLQLYRKGT